MFNPEIITFFENLENNNNKEWFNQNKSDYEKYVKQPIKELAEDLKFEFGDAHIFRINRDVRFSSDKRPYKTNVSLFITGSAGFGLYFEMSKNHIRVGGGGYDIQKDQLQRWRQNFDTEDGEKIKDFLNQTKKKGFDLIEDDKLTSAPRGYAKDHPDLYFLQLKRLAIGKFYPLENWAFSEKLSEVVRQDFKLLQEWCQLLNKYVGATKIEKKRY